MSQNKAEIREHARTHLEKINVMEEQPDAATALFFEGINIADTQILAGYWPIGHEFDPTGILEQAVKNNIPCALPVVEDNTKILTFRPWTPQSPMRKGAFNIPEPDSTETCIPDIILVPLLAFDQRGTRLGKGGGYYDATLNALRAQKDIQAIGVGYAAQAVLFNLPREDHDEPLNAILTPQEFRKF